MDVVTTPPEGNDPEAPGQRMLMSNCRHMWEPQFHPLGGKTGYMVCLRCHNRVRAPKAGPRPYTPKPVDSYTGY